MTRRHAMLYVGPRWVEGVAWAVWVLVLGAAFVLSPRWLVLGLGLGLLAAARSRVVVAEDGLVLVMPWGERFARWNEVEVRSARWPRVEVVVAGERFLLSWPGLPGRGFEAFVASLGAGAPSRQLPFELVPEGDGSATEALAVLYDLEAPLAARLHAASLLRAHPALWRRVRMDVTQRWADPELRRAVTSDLRRES